MNRPFIAGSAARQIAVAMPHRIAISCQSRISLFQKKKCQIKTVKCAESVIAAQAGASSARTLSHLWSQFAQWLTGFRYFRKSFPLPQRGQRNFMPRHMRGHIDPSCGGGPYSV